MDISNSNKKMVASQFLTTFSPLQLGTQNSPKKLNLRSQENRTDPGWRLTVESLLRQISSEFFQLKEALKQAAASAQLGISPRVCCPQEVSHWQWHFGEPCCYLKSNSLLALFRRKDHRTFLVSYCMSSRATLEKPRESFKNVSSSSHSATTSVTSLYSYTVVFLPAAILESRVCSN